MTASNPELSLSFVSEDLVDFRENVYLRKLLLANLADRESHVSFAASILEYLEKLEKIEVCPSCGVPLCAHHRQGRPHVSAHGS